ncbi:MAG: GntR family transcriptional regulator [Acidimicrobiales bacterium]|nr:GntR family transcriptional regulator [Acidimicrobiales bacterium]
MMDLKPVDRRSVSDDVFDQLAGQILGGRLGPGAPLPAERQLTEHLKVNRQAVREALKRLEQVGLVDIRHGGGTRVADFRRGAGLDLLPRLLLLPDGSINPHTVRSIMEMRAAIGPDIARRCAERARAPQVSALAEVVESLALADDDLGQLSTLDLAFWDALTEGADNIAYRLAFNSLRSVYEPAAPLLREALAPELRDLAGHRAIAQAVARGNGPAAARAAQRLLALGTAVVVDIVSAVVVHKEEPA